MSINYNKLEEINDTLKIFPSTKLQIVTKNRSTEIIKELIDKGYNLFGENKVQEANDKFKNFNTNDLDLHLIGPLQTNKVKLALQVFNTIQTIDREKLVNEIYKIQNKFTSKTSNFFIQINIGEEEQKSGVSPDKLEQLYKLCIDRNLKIVGLMCIPPISDNSQIYFERMHELRDKLDSNLKLSMGMSSDYEIALKCGSNLIRVGSKIFS